MQKTLQPKLILVAILAAYSAPQYALAEDKTEAIALDKVEVISTTPLPSVGLPINQIPSNVQTVKAKDLERTQSLDITEYMNRNMGGVYINEVQNNPLQPDLNYRGYTASPLLGTPQGLSVYMDGVRMNQPFGDVVSWDLIPKNAIANMQLMPGSNPLFGLNTLGGAVSIQTKDGRNSPGGAVQFTYGSNARKMGEFEYGDSKDNIDWVIAGTAFDENGWRDASESDYQQLFGKIGWHGDKTDAKLTYAYANTDLNGNGMVPESFLKRDRSSVYTYPDNTQNESHFLNLELSHYFTDNVVFSGNTYYRHIKTKTFNGDINDEALPEFVGGAGQRVLPSAFPANSAYTLAGNQLACAQQLVAGGEPGEKCTGIINRTQSQQDNLGLFGQLTVNHKLFEKANVYTLGAGVDYSDIKFGQTAEFGSLNLDRSIVGSGQFANNVSPFEIDGGLDDRSAQIKGTTTTWSLFGTDTISLQDNLQLTLSGRYNKTQVKNRDQHTHFAYDPAISGFTTDIDSDASLDGTHSFNRFNPAIGLTFNPSQSLNTYVGYNEGNRAPTAVELSCANENAPCSLPNSFAGDPPLKQVVSKTWEAGLRGKLSNNVTWNAGVFSSRNIDDILFVTANASQGFFKNFGKTRRRGIETSLAGSFGDFNLGGNYTFIDATYQTDETVLGAANSSQDAVDHSISIKAGDRIPLVPRNILKLFADYQVNDKLTIGANTLSVSGSYLRGNDNNNHQAGGSYLGDGKIGGYTVVDFTAAYRIKPNWMMFAKLNNAFDREYATAGQLGQNPFNASGTLNLVSRRTTSVGEDFVSPGAPRSAWVGVRYEFGGKKPSASVDHD
jgi:outer membrane receptor protein involved in Fe transport